MKYSWKTIVAIAALGLLAAMTVQNAMATGYGHAAAGTHSMPGHAGKSNHYDKGRYDGRYRDFRGPSYGDRYGRHGYGGYGYGRYGYGFYSSYWLPSLPYYPSCYGPYCLSCFANNRPCREYNPVYPCCPSCDSPFCGFDDYCGGGWDTYGKEYRHHRDRDGRRGGKGGEHRPGSTIGHENSSGTLSHVALSGAHGSRG